MRPSRTSDDGATAPPGDHRTVAAAVAELPPLPVLLGLKPQTSTTPSPPPGTRAPRRAQGASPPSALVPLTPAGAGGDGEVSSRTAWRCVEASLDLPLVYRKSEDVALTLQLLRQFPVFGRLTDDELLALAADMHMFSTRGKGVVIAEKMAVAAEAVTDADYVVPFSSDEDDELGHGSGLAPDYADGSEPGPPSVSRPSLGDANSPAAPRQSSAGRESRQSVASTLATSGEPYPEAPLYALAQGRALVELPTVSGKRHFPVQEGDVMALDLHWQCLPTGARYLTKEPCTLLRWNPTRGSRLARVLRRCQKYVLEAQVTFLTKQLTVPLFTLAADDAVRQQEVAANVARCLVPLRLSAQQVVVEEGEEADAMYFVTEGRLAVTRTVSATAARHAAQGSTSPRRSKSSGAAPTRVMEVAELQTGELFGELALLAYNPDTRPGEGVVWDAAYWREALKRRFQVEGRATSPGLAGIADDDDGADFIRSLRRTRRSTTTSRGFSASGESELHVPAALAGSGGGDVTGQDDDDDDEAVFEELRYPAQTTPRLATVYARTPALIYSLAYTDCRRRLHGHALTCLSEFAKGYPAHSDLLEEFEKRERWVVYKKNVVEEVVRNNPNHRAKAPLAPFKY